MSDDVSLVALRCRTSERTAAPARGVEALAQLLGNRLGREPRLIGSAGEPHDGGYGDDLRDSRGCLLEAGGQVDDALSAGNVPLLLAGECSIAATTLPTVARLRPDAKILWLDAHGDFNTPDTTTSAYLGGMALAAACGIWETGLTSDRVETGKVVLTGVRDLEGDERIALERSDVTVIGASPVETLVAVKNALDGAPVYVHLDLDVLDPEIFPARFPAPGGFAPEKLFDLLEAVVEDCELVGIEVTSFEAPEDREECQAAASIALHALEPLLDRLPVFASE
jgi:arginase family enzyme